MVLKGLWKLFFWGWIIVALGFSGLAGYQAFSVYLSASALDAEGDQRVAEYYPLAKKVEDQKWGLQKACGEFGDNALKKGQVDIRVLVSSGLGTKWSRISTIGQKRFLWSCDMNDKVLSYWDKNPRNSVSGALMKCSSGLYSYTSFDVPVYCRFDRGGKAVGVDIYDSLSGHPMGAFANVMSKHKYVIKAKNSGVRILRGKSVPKSDYAAAQKMIDHLDFRAWNGREQAKIEWSRFWNPFWWSLGFMVLAIVPWIINVLFFIDITLDHRVRMKALRNGGTDS